MQPWRQAEVKWYCWVWEGFPVPEILEVLAIQYPADTLRKQISLILCYYIMQNDMDAKNFFHSSPNP